METSYFSMALYEPSSVESSRILSKCFDCRPNELQLCVYAWLLFIFQPIRNKFIRLDHEPSMSSLFFLYSLTA